MDNLLSSTEVGTIFLDRELTIRKFTPQIAETFSLVAHDVGRSIDTFAHRLDHPELLEDLRRVVSTGVPFEMRAAQPPGQDVLHARAAVPGAGAVRRRRAHAHRRERPQGRRGRALPRALPARQPARRRARRHLLQGRARALHPDQPGDGAAPGTGRSQGRRGQDRSGDARPSPRDLAPRRGRGGAADGASAALPAREARSGRWLRRLGADDASAIARPRRQRRRHHRHLAQRDRAEARRGARPRGGAAARSVPGHAVARAAKPAGRDRQRHRAAPAHRGRLGEGGAAGARRDGAAVAPDDAAARRPSRGRAA